MSGDGKAGWWLVWSVTLVLLSICGFEGKCFLTDHLTESDNPVRIMKPRLYTTTVSKLMSLIRQMKWMVTILIFC